MEYPTTDLELHTTSVEPSGGMRNTALLASSTSRRLGTVAVPAFAISRRDAVVVLLSTTLTPP